MGPNPEVLSDTVSTTAAACKRPAPTPASPSIPYNLTVAEDKGKEEEKLGFTAEGEKLGYFTYQNAINDYGKTIQLDPYHVFSLVLY
jgi:hypothetical protein